MRDNIGRLVLSALLVAPERDVLADETSTLSRAGLMTEVAAQVEAFRAAGLGADDFLVVLCGRGSRFWVDLLAAWVIGAKPVAVEADIDPDHGRSVLDMTGAAYVAASGVSMPEVFAGLAPLASTFDPARSAGDIRATFDGLPFADDAEMPEMAGLIFTSGTTGLPKGVPLTHRALILNALATARRLQLTAEDRLLIATPYRFISSISHCLVTLLSGAVFTGIERTLMIKDLIDALNAHKITAFGGSPFHAQFIAMAGTSRLPHLRWLMSSGDHLRPTVIDQLRAAFDDLTLHVVYGMAELGGRFCMLPPADLDAKRGSVGYPIDGLEVSIRDEAGAPCAPGDIGEIYVRGHLGFEGYFRNPKANAKVLGPHGFRNGDKGYRDADGYIWLAGRSDSVFKRSGLKVSAQVVADALTDQPEIRDAYVTGQPDPMEGHVPVAYLAMSDEAADLSDADVLARLRAAIPNNHLPARILRLSTIPRTGSGKVDRRRLDALVAEETS